jgi:hypothetical protein
MNGLNSLHVMVITFGLPWMKLSVQRRASGAEICLGAAAAPGNSAVPSATTSSQHHRTYIRTRRKRPRNTAAQDDCEDDSDQQDDVQAVVDQDQPLQHESIDEDESVSVEREATGDGEAFHLDEDLLL